MEGVHDPAITLPLTPSGEMRSVVPGDTLHLISSWRGGCKKARRKDAGGKTGWERSSVVCSLRSPECSMVPGAPSPLHASLSHKLSIKDTSSSSFDLRHLVVLQRLNQMLLFFSASCLSPILPLTPNTSSPLGFSHLFIAQTTSLF